jgi:hypothetical protein
MRDIIEKLNKSTANVRMLERLDQLRYEQQLHENTVTVNLVKCKRQDAHLLDDIDFEIENGTGRLLRLNGFTNTTTDDMEEYETESILGDDW